MVVHREPQERCFAKEVRSLEYGSLTWQKSLEREELEEVVGLEWSAAVWWAFEMDQLSFLSYLA